MLDMHERHDDNTAHRPRVLFVDDSRLMRFAARRWLETRFEVVLAEDGESGWERLCGDPRIEAVITDLMMPGIGGIELIRRIRSAPMTRVRELPIMVVTSMEEAAGRDEAMDAGANRLVPKPFSADDLLDPLRIFLRQAEPDEGGHHAAPNLERNRFGLLARMRQATCLHDRLGLPWCLVHVRLENRRVVADRFGSRWGESMMRHLERALLREVRIEDSVGRSASDTYSLLLPATPEEGARLLRNRLRRSLSRQPARFPGRSLELEISFCIQLPEFGDEAEALLDEGLARLDAPPNVTRLPTRNNL